MSIIEDGLGTGKKTQVTVDNRLNASTRSNGRIFYESRDNESAYLINLGSYQVVGEATETLGYLKYNGRGRLHIHSITFSTDEPGDGLSKMGIWAGTENSGGTEKTATNMNFTSAQEAETECYYAPGITSTGGASIGTIRFKGPGSWTRNYDDALILGLNDEITIKMALKTAGSQGVATIEFWEHKD